MVLHHRRAGGQSQHSALLDLDIEVRSDRVQAVLQYARRNLSGNLSVERLAAVACLSPRQFSRLFRLETGVSPAKAVENLRLESARFLLEQGRLPIERSLSTAASATGKGCGAASCARMVKARSLFARGRTRSWQFDVSNVPMFAAACRLPMRPSPIKYLTSDIGPSGPDHRAPACRQSGDERTCGRNLAGRPCRSPMCGA
jgi:AraC-like DNA-binding protein